MVIEPPISSAPGGSNSTGSYEGRWRWWYSGIADWMLRNPGGTMTDCARELNKAPNTIRAIAQTDLFRDYFAQRKREWQQDHDEALRSKLTHVAELTLDAVAEKLEKQRDKVDLPLLTTLLESSLDRLGFAPQAGPMVQFNQINQDLSTKNIQLPGSVTAAALEEARFALRAAQSQGLLPRPRTTIEGSGAGKGAEPQQELLTLEPVVEQEDPDADSSASS